MKGRSLRFRLTAWYSLALAAGLVVFAVAIWTSMRASLLRDVDARLASRSQGLRSFVVQESRTPGVHLAEELSEYAAALPAGELVGVQRAGGMVMASQAAFPFPFAPGVKRVRWKGGDYRVYLEGFGSGFLVCTVASLEGVESQLARLGWLLVGLVPLVVATATVGGNWLSRRALRPVDDITRAARAVSIGNLAERLAVPRTGDELQRLAETWNGMLERLEAAVRRLSRFTADASHELRTPLAVIRTTAEIAARRERPAEEYREALGQVVSESERMTGLVEDLLFLARCDSEATEMPMETLDLAVLAEEVGRQVAALGEARGVAVLTRVAGRVEVSGNDMAIRRLLLVLLDNAIKYSQAGSAVEVRVEREAGAAVVEVADRGIGIAGEVLPHIFERFYRAGNGAAGYGLGLSLADGIAKRHGARIEVASECGVGSTFRVVFGGGENGAIWRVRATIERCDNPGFSVD